MVNPENINLMENHLKILETGFRLFPETGWEANFRIFGFEHPLAGNTQGFGISFDQLIANHFTIFGRYGKNQPRLAEWHGVEKAWSTGLGFKQTILARNFNVGLAWAETFAFGSEHPEQLAELYLSNQINRWVFLSPHLQWVKTASHNTKEHWLAGIRLNFSY